MCGISGGFNVNIASMVNMQTHRGPDNAHHITIGNVSLGHNRLSIIDVSQSGNQPMQYENLTLTFNGEIYNYQDLKRYLTEYEFKGTSDSEVLLYYCHKFGIDKFLKDAVGMFAFSLYDGQKLTLAVDQFSQKPIYWFHYRETFAFASQPNALYQYLPEKKLNEQAVQNYFCLGAPFGEQFLIEGIHKLQGSHKLEFANNKVKISRYWDPIYQTDTSQIEYFINDAIEKVKVSDVPVYLFLSGGIDSTVCATRMKGYNAVYLDGPEYEYAKEAAEKCGLNLEVVKPEPHNAEECLTDAIKKNGVPGMATLIPYITAKYVSQKAKVAVIANGADELFYGYDRIYSPNVKRNYDKQLPHLFRTDFNHNVPSLPIDPDFGPSGLSRWLELNTFVQYDLNQTLDHASMCHSLEIRSPFLDHRLVEMALSISDTQHLHEYGNKSILKRKLLNNGFSRKFTDRQKLGFSLFKEPLGWERLRNESYDWCIKQGFIQDYKLLGRDLSYAKSASASFYIFIKSL